MSELKTVPREVAIKSLLQSSFRHFIRFFWDEVITEPFVGNWHIDYLAKELQQIVIRCAAREPKKADLIINIPPGTTKSTICTIMLPAWAWTVDPSLRILTASYSGSLSMHHAGKSRDVIRSDKYRELFPEVQIRRDQDNKAFYATKQGGERYATSTLGSVTGFHAHLIIVDDPISAQQALSEAMLKSAENFIEGTLSTRKIDKAGTPTIMVMQRLHHKDPAGVWLAREKEPPQHICLPGILTPNVKPPELAEKYVDGYLDPNRLGETQIEAIRTRLGSYGFAGQILQEPIPLEGAIWQAENFKAIKRSEIPELSKLGTDWDLAYTKNETNSASAYIQAGVHDKKMYVTRAGAIWKEFPEMIKFMKTIDGGHYVEAKASGKSAVQVLKKQGVPAVEVNVPGGGDKIARTTLASPYAEAGLIYIAEDIIDYVLFDPSQGITKFPGGVHDDLNDAFVQAINRLLAKRKVMVF